MTLRKITAAAATLVVSAAAFVGLATPASAGLSGGDTAIYVTFDHGAPDAALFDDMYFEIFDGSGALIFESTPRSTEPIGVENFARDVGRPTECWWNNGATYLNLTCLYLSVGTYTIGVAGEDSSVDVYVDFFDVSSYPGVTEPLADSAATFTTVANNYSSLYLDYEVANPTTSNWVSEIAIDSADDGAMADAVLEVYDDGGALVYSTRTFADLVLAGSSNDTAVLGGTCFDGTYGDSSTTYMYFYCYNLPVGNYTVGVSGTEFAFSVDSTFVKYGYLVDEPLAGSSSTLALDSTLDYLTTITYSEVLAATGLSSEFLNGSVFAAVGLIGLGAGALVLARRRQGAAA